LNGFSRQTGAHQSGRLRRGLGREGQDGRPGRAEQPPRRSGVHVVLARYRTLTATAKPLLYRISLSPGRAVLYTMKRVSGTPLLSETPVEDDHSRPQPVGEVGPRVLANYIYRPDLNAPGCLLGIVDGTQLKARETACVVHGTHLKTFHGSFSDVGDADTPSVKSSFA